ncbi:MAG: BspA family leucine-rich repeat surface protein, partial [Bacteroidales bacterium]
MNIKKSILLSVIVIIINTIGVIAQDFITTWQTTSDNEPITIPTQGAGYSYTVDWGDGSSDANVYTDDATHVYASAGIYTVSISGNFPWIVFYYSSDKHKIKSIEQWGGQVWATMNYAFYGCSNLVVNATDAPDLSYATNTECMFYDAPAFNQDISHWDVSNIIHMS